MPLSSLERLRSLGRGDSLDAVAEAAGISRNEILDWWSEECRRRVPKMTGTLRAGVSGPVKIERDQLGIPRISAEKDEDLFFGFGYAMAQDRLFQIDYLRRRGAGRLAEILGPSNLELDLTARTIGLPQIAEREWEETPAETRQLLEAFSRGVNALIEDSREALPIEFDLLDYAPEPWRPQDCLVIAGEFRWYLTGRFPVISIPELAKRTLGAGPLYQAFLGGEMDEEYILPSTGANSASPPTGGGPYDGSGSNNWVISGTRTASGKPLLASDPHIAMQAVSCWYQVHLDGGSFHTAGIAYAGMPAVMFGRNQQVAWGITNNICSVRDLYQEKTDPAHPGCFLFDGKWEPAQERHEEIKVKGGETVRTTVRSSRNGPIVDAILPAPARHTGPVSVRWQGADYCGWMPALLNMDRAKTVAEFRTAMEPWRVPTFSVVIADTEGTIAYQASGRLPIREGWDRGYRRGWDRADQWQSLIPTAGMPHTVNPPQGFVVTANNKPAPADFPYPLSSTANNGQRAARIRTMIEAEPHIDRTACAAMQMDALSPRAADCVPLLLKHLAASSCSRTRAAVPYLSNWDFRIEPDRVGATLFNFFFTQWSLTITRERFPEDQAALLAPAVGGLATRLLRKDDIGWFQGQTREAALTAAWKATLDQLAAKAGPNLLDWAWGRIHVMSQKHLLGDRGDLGLLLNRSGLPVKGDGVTVCNTGADPSWEATMGAGYRQVVDLHEPGAMLHFIDAGAESGHPGSPHYDDQLTTWANGEYHSVSLNEPAPATTTFTLDPRGEG